MDILNRVAEELLEKETINAERFEELFVNKQPELPAEEKNDEE